VPEERRTTELRTISMTLNDPSTGSITTHQRGLPEARRMIRLALVVKARAGRGASETVITVDAVPVRAGATDVAEKVTV
jgi:hypothetical protein